MGAKTNNLGQIAAIWISAVAPENQKLIWYNTLERIHKVYDTAAGEWAALNPQIVTESTISDLRIIASHSGLSLGKFFYLTDVGTLAVAITTTKIWYVDSFNNYVVNDLAANITAYINSDNLLIDGSTGVWNNATVRLEFNFSEVATGANLQTDNDYIVLRRKNGNTWNWIKAKLGGFISAVSGNSIRWNNGFYFNFTTAINEIKNIAGGIVGFEQYDSDKRDLQRNIASISQDNQQIFDASKTDTDTEVGANTIYGKQYDGNWNLLENPPQIPNISSELRDILRILVSWVNVLKNSNRINIGVGFSDNGKTGDVNYSDTVRSAIEKIVYKIKHQSIADGIVLPNSFNFEDYLKELPIANDNITTAIGKLSAYLSKLTDDVWGAKFRDDDWYASISVGDKIGEFDSNGNPLYTASLEGAIYLLSAWYSERIGLRTQVSNYNAYYTSGRGDVRAERSTIISMKSTEVGLNFKISSSLNILTYQEDRDYLFSSFTNDDACLIIRDLPSSVTRRIAAEYGYAEPININIPIVAKWGSNPFKAIGVLYAILVQPPQDSDADAYLKFFPYYMYVEKMLSEPSFSYDNEGVNAVPDGFKDYIGETSVNETGEFGSGWMKAAGYWEEIIQVYIPKFNFTLPCK